MGTFILKRKTFSKSKFMSKKDWMKVNGYTPDASGKFSTSDWADAEPKYQAAKKGSTSTGISGGSGGSSGGGSGNSFKSSKPNQAAIDAAKKEAERQEAERLAKIAEENSVITKGKKFLKENKTPILIGGGLILATGAGYGLYKHSQTNNQKRRDAERNDKIRNRIVGKVYDN